MENNTQIETTDTGAMTEEQALADLSNMGNEPTDIQNDSVNVEETNTDENANVDNTNIDDLDLSNMDLSFLEIESNQSESNPDEIVETPQPETQEQSTNQLDEIKEMISNVTQTQEQQSQIPEEEAAAVKQLFGKFQELGLIPKEFGLTEEQQALLDKASTINEKLEAQEREEKEYAEHQTKLSELKSFDEKLSKSIPGYDSKLIQKTVADISKSNPKAAQKIFDNPTLLMDLWNQIGAKAQPRDVRSNVISSNGQQSSKLSGLEEKVMNGTATEQEEAEWLAGA